MKHFNWPASALAIALLALSVASWGADNAPAGIIVRDRTLVPVRYLAKWLGASVNYDTVTRRITLHKPPTKMLLTIDSAKATLDKKKCMLPTQVIYRKRVTDAPLRFVAEGFGVDVQWDKAKKQATLWNPDNGEWLTIDATHKTHVISARAAAGNKKSGSVQRKSKDIYILGKVNYDGKSYATLERSDVKYVIVWDDLGQRLAKEFNGKTAEVTGVLTGNVYTELPPEGFATTSAMVKHSELLVLSFRKVE